MATIFIVLVLVVLVLNAVIMRSKTQWWRDPKSLFSRPVEEPEPVAPAPVADDPRNAADWVRAAQARAAEMAYAAELARARGVVPRVAGAEARRATDPRELEPRRPAETPAQPVAGPPMTAASRHAMRPEDAMTDVFARIPDEEAPTQLLGRIPAGYPEAPGR